MDSPPLPPWPYPRWIAHRGGGALAPENTLAAFRLGAARGYRGYECDVKLSADGVAYLLHDDELDRTTDGHGPAARPWAELARLDAGAWHGPAFAGESLPTLAAVAAHVLAAGHALNIELKPGPGEDAATGRRVALEAARLWAAAAIPPLLSSFRPDALAAAREAAPGLPRALLLDRLAPGWEEQVRSLGCIAAVLHFPLLDAALFARLRAMGLRVACYTVNDAGDARRLLDLGVDSLITDAVDRFDPARG